MSSPSAPKDKFFDRVINPYLAEVLHHPQTIEMREGVLHIRDVEGPRRIGSVETKLEDKQELSFPHQKLSFFYHLPTRGRAGIKLGDADMSPSYL